MIVPGVLVWLGLAAAAAAQSATPSNLTYVTPRAKNMTVVLALNEGSNTWQPYFLSPLTMGALDRLPVRLFSSRDTFRTPWQLHRTPEY